MDKNLITAAVAALDALIDSELHSTGPGRYGRIIKLSRQAHDLVQMSVTRVKDVDRPVAGNIYVADGSTCCQNPVANGDDVYDDGVETRDGAGHMAIRQGGGGGADNIDLLREVVAGMQMAFKPRELAPPSPIEQLHALLDLRERLAAVNKPVDVVDRQIDEMMSKVTKEELDVGTARSNLARPVVLRRHPAGADVDGVLGDHGGALGEGEGGADDAVEAGGEEKVAARG